MTRALLVLIGLYLAWRMAVIVGRRRARAYEEAMVRRGWVRGRSTIEARCSLCGRPLGAYQLRREGLWPLRRVVCASGCEGGDDDRRVG